MNGTGPSKRVAIVQSCYVPWKGYFDLVNAVDEFVLLDTVQYTRRDWRNRNRIRTEQGTCWLTIPVATKGRFRQSIGEVQVAGAWAEPHWARLRQAYRHAPCFRDVAPAVEALYRACWHETKLSTINRVFIAGIASLLGIATPLRAAAEYPDAPTASERLLAICRATGCTDYVSGPSAAAYLDTDAFAAAGIRVTFADYGGYPEYRQAWPGFVHEVSILDMLFNLGAEAPRYLKTFPRAC